MYLTKAQPVPIRASVMKSSAPLSLQGEQVEVIQQKHAAGELRLLQRRHLQVCDVIHDGPALNRMTFRVDEVIVDLKTGENQDPGQV